MLVLVEQSREAFAGALGEPRSATVPASNQTRHGFSGRFGRAVSASHSQHFQRLPHHLRLGPAGLTRYSFKQVGHFRINPNAEFAHRGL